MKKLFSFPSGSIFLLVLIFGCTREIDIESLEQPNYEGEWQGPVATTTITIRDMVEYAEDDIPIEYFYDEEDGTYTILYYDSLPPQGVPEEYYKLDDQEESGEITIDEDDVPGDYPNTGGVYIVPPNLPIESFPVDTIYKAVLDSLPLDNENEVITDAKIETVVLSSGVLEVNFRSDFNHDVVIEATITSIILDDQTNPSFTIRVGPSYGRFSASRTVDLSQARFDLYDAASDNYNELEMVLNTEIFPIEGGTFTTDDKIEFDINLSNMTYDYIIGQFGTFEIPTEPGDIEFSVFESGFDEFDVTLSDPKVILEMGNSTGLPLKMVINQMQFVNDGSTDAIDINRDTIPMNFVQNIAQRGERVRTEYVIDKNNAPNIQNIFQTAPDRLNYDVSIIVDGQEGESYWLASDSDIDARVEGQIPLEGAITTYNYSDTTDFDSDEFSIDDVINEDTGDTLVDYGNVRIVSINSLPFDMAVQFYMLDEDYNVIDSLFDDGFSPVFASSEVDSEGYLVAPTTQSLDVFVDKAKVTNLSKTIYIVTAARASTTDDGTTIVKILGDYGFEIKLGAKVKFNIPLDN